MATPIVALLVLYGSSSCSNHLPPKSSVGAGVDTDDTIVRRDTEAELAKDTRPKFSSDRWLVDAELVRLIRIASSGHVASRLQQWSVGVLKEPGPAPGVDSYYLDDVPEWIRQIDSESGVPMVDVRCDQGAAESNVMLVWGKGGTHLWGLMLGNQELDPKYLDFQFIRLRHGVFAFHFFWYPKPPDPSSPQK
jgi:hypothetical protein